MINSISVLSEDTGEGKEDEKEDDVMVHPEEQTGLVTHDNASDKKETFAEKDAVTNPLLSMGKEELKCKCGGQMKFINFW